MSQGGGNGNVGARLAEQSTPQGTQRSVPINAAAALLQSTASSILMRRHASIETCDPCRECTTGTQKGICGYRNGLLSCVPYCNLDPSQPPEQGALGPACPLINKAEPEKDWQMLRSMFCQKSAAILEQEDMQQPDS